MARPSLPHGSVSVRFTSCGNFWGCIATALPFQWPARCGPRPFRVVFRRGVGEGGARVRAPQNLGQVGERPTWIDTRIRVVGESPMWRSETGAIRLWRPEPAEHLSRSKVVA